MPAFPAFKTKPYYDQLRDFLAESLDLATGEIKDSAVDAKADQAALAAHEVDTENPHHVTKAQVGLGNVDNTSDANKPISTATQTALDAKQAKPATAGNWYQLLRQGVSEPAWVDPPGMLPPTLLLSPDGSVDRSGLVAPSVSGGVSIVAGAYSNAWKVFAGTSVRLVVPSYISTQRGAMAVRWKAGAESGTAINIGSGSAGSETFWISHHGHLGYRSNNGAYQASTVTEQVNEYRSCYVEWDVAAIRVFGPQGRRGALARSGIQPSWSTATPYIDIGSRFTTNAAGHEVESVVFFDRPLTDREREQLFAATSWHFDSFRIAAESPLDLTTPTTLMGLFPPNKKIAAGGTTLRTAPGASTTAITTLAAGADVHSTGQTITASSVSYTLVMTALGQGFVPTSSLI